MSTFKPIFEKLENQSNTYSTKWKCYASAKDKADFNHLCYITEYHREGDSQTYCKVEDTDVILALNRFPIKEIAAAAVFNVRFAMSKCPMPVEVKRFLERSAEDLRRAHQHFDSLRSSIFFLRKTVMDVSRQYGVELFDKEAEVDPLAAFRSLLEWTPEFGLPEKALKAAGKETGMPFSKEFNAAPFLSQAVIYPLLGKEGARTFFSLLRQALETAGVQTEEFPYI